MKIKADESRDGQRKKRIVRGKVWQVKRANQIQIGCRLTGRK